MKLDNKYVIGLTGGIGCGKTMVLEHLKTKYNAFVIEADKIGHQIMDFESCMNNHHLLFLLDLHQIGLLYPNKISNYLITIF